MNAMVAQPPHVIVSFDMETDLGNWGSTYEGVRQGTPAILEILARHALQATFLFTADAAQACPEAVQSVLAAGCEVGCHGLRHEFLGEATSDTPGLFTLLPEEIGHRLELATAAVAAIAGVRPVSFRCPRLQGSNQVIQALQRLGYVADSSYPTYFYGKQLGPYYPHRDDWREAGDPSTALRQSSLASSGQDGAGQGSPLPSVGDFAGQALPVLELPLFADFTEPPADPTDPFMRARDGWPRLRLEGGARFKQRIDRMSRYLHERGQPAFACLYLHPWEFVPTPRELVFGEGRLEVAEWLWQNSGPAHLAALDELLDLLRKDGATFWRMNDFAAAWPRV
jgi:peptidoglycan/xylan/chitin deacetylase (PgdA/CDA1 family)